MQKVSPIRAAAWTTILAALLLANAVSPRVAGADPAASPVAAASASPAPSSENPLVTSDISPGTAVIDAARSTPSPSPEPADTPTDTPEPTPSPLPAPAKTARPHRTPQPWLFGSYPPGWFKTHRASTIVIPHVTTKRLPTLTPHPTAATHPKASPSAKPSPARTHAPVAVPKKRATGKGSQTIPSASKTLKLPIPEPLPALTPPPLRIATPRPTHRPRPAPSPSPEPSDTPSPEPTETPVPTAAPTALPKRSNRRAPVPSPTSTLEATAAPAATEPPPGVETPIPTQPPTPRPIAPNQPTIPESLSDPNVRGIMERPIRQLSQVGWMTGTWHATGTVEYADGTAKPLEPTTWVFAPVLKDRWMFGADGRSTDFFYVTFDPFARHWVALRFAANPAYGIWTSEKGWVGNRIDFVTNFSYANGRQYRRRLTIIHKDPRTFGIYETEQLPDGNWTPDDAVEFTKS